MRSLFLFSVSLVALVGSVAQGTVIDDFSADSSAAYNAVYSPGVGTPFYGVNASGQFQSPTGDYGDTTGWLRNDGYKFDVGDTISLDVIVGTGTNNLTANTSGLVSLTWGSLPNALTNDATHKVVNMYYENIGGASTLYFFDAGANIWSQSISINAGSTIAMTATRTALNTVNYGFAYTDSLGVAQSITRSRTESLTSTSYYFGMLENQYRAKDGGNNCMDNLSHSAVPEPGTLAVLTTALFGLLAYAWRKRK
jgi:hypothetical protein